MKTFFHVTTKKNALKIRKDKRIDENPEFGGVCLYDSYDNAKAFIMTKEPGKYAIIPVYLEEEPKPIGDSESTKIEEKGYVTEGPIVHPHVELKLRNIPLFTKY